MAVLRLFGGTMPKHPSSLDDLERALALAAFLVARHGNRFAPILERVEREIEEARRADPAERAQRILERYRDAGGVKAIRSSQP